MRRIKTHGLSRRLTAVLLCVCMVTSLISGIGITKAYAGKTAGSGATNGVTREADPSTMDTYRDMLDFSENTRYAGRLWSDKTVFALGYQGPVDANGTPVPGYDRDENWNGSALTLTEADDGVSGSVKLSDDFLHVYSVLGSSLEAQEVAPLDVMFVVDVSGSMGQLLNETGEKIVAENNRFEETPIFKTVGAVNSAIKQLLTASPESRFGIAIYGSTAAVLVPLGHYTQSGETDFLKVTYGEIYGGDQGLHFKLEATVAVEQEGGKPQEVKYYADNAGDSSNTAHNTSVTSGNATYAGTGGRTTGTGQSDEPYHVGHITNPQAGLAAAMDQFIENEERTWKTNDNEEYLRIPALIHLTDGQASDIAWIQPEVGEEIGGEEWAKDVSNWNNVNWKYDLAYNSKNRNSEPNSYWNVSQLTGTGDAAPVIFQTLMTAAYYKSAVDAFYNRDGSIKDANGKPVSLACYSIYASDDKGGYNGLSENQVKGTIDAILGPTDYFKDNESFNKVTTDPLAEDATSEQCIDAAYELYKAWATTESVNVAFTKNTTSVKPKPNEDNVNDITITLNATQEQAESGMYAGKDWCSIDAEDIKTNINYVPSGNFKYTGFGGLTGVFSDIIQELTGTMFTPVSGQNDLGVGNAVTFMDPMGKYMEVKDVMGVSLFGHYYGIVKTAVYDYQWNDAYMRAKNPGQAGQQPMPAGWYYGDAASAQYAAQLNVTGCDTAAAAWAAGWVYRVGYDIAGQFVPTLKDIYADNESPDEMTTKAKETEYTFYRLDKVDGTTLDDKARQTLHVNPAYIDAGKEEKDYLTGVEYDKSGAGKHKLHAE